MRSSEIVLKQDANQQIVTDHSEYRLHILNRLVAISFHPIWEWLIEVVIVLSIFNAIYVTFFSTNESNLFLYYYCLEAIFLCDTLISYIHRFYVRKFSLNLPRSVIILLIDTLSLLPIYECCYVAFPQWATPTLHRLQQLKTILRVVHLVATLFLERFVSIKMNIAMLKLTHVFLLLLMNLLLACWWSYVARCWPECTSPNWTDSLIYLTGLRLEEPLIWFLTCLTTISDVLIHGSTGFLIDRNDAESFIILTSMIIGFSMHSFFEVAHTFNNYVDVLRPRYNYKLHLKELQCLFDSCGDDEDNKKLRLRTFQYYDMLWKKRKGIVGNEELIYELPMILVKEVMVDVYYEALIHSHIFSQLSPALKRELCICMQTEYYLPGDCLFLPEQSYANMFYLHSGVINVISYEDYQTSILSLAAGTILGESSLCMINISNTMVKCATECEVKLLPMATYNRLAARYHESFSYIQRSISNRIDVARSRLKYNNTAVERTAERCTRLKKQWRCVAALHAYELKHDCIDRETWPKLDKGFHSKYLNLIVLADKLTADRAVICFNAKCPYVMNPNTSFRNFFVYLHLVVVVLHALYLPYYHIFKGYISQEIVLLNITVDLIFFLDIYMQSISYVVNDDIVIVKAKELLLYKLKKTFFLVDLFTSLPYDYFGIMMGATDSSYFFLRSPKFVQWYKLIQLIIKLENSVINKSYFILFVKYFIIYFSVLYLSTCYQFLNFNFGQHGRDAATQAMPIADYPILSCFFYTLSAICLLGLSEIMATTMHGMLMYSLLTFIGCYLLNFCIVEISCNIVKNNEDHYKHLKHFKTADDFLISNSLAQKYNKYLNAYYGFLWQFNKNIEVKPDAEMPEYNIYIKNIVRILRQVPAFANFTDKLLELIAARAHVRVHPPGYELSCVDDRNIHLHILAKGYCSMALFMPGDREKNIVKTLKPGDCFNLLEVLHSLDSFNTIKTLTAVEELSVSASDIWDVLETDQQELNNFQSALKWHYEKHYTILNVTKQSDFLIKETKKRMKAQHVIYFKYVIDDNYDFDRGRTKKRQLRKQLGMLHYFMLKNTIDPAHKYYIAWEILRSGVAIGFGFITFLNATILKEYYVFKYTIFGIVEVVFLFDIYLRAHLQYYNEEGIKVTYIYSTIMHYVKTSMPLDVIASVPLVWWPLYIRESYQFTLNVIIAIVYYASLFHRPVQGLVYVEAKINDIRNHLATALRNLIIVFVVVAIVGNNMLLAVCAYNEKDGYTCTSTINYISSSPFANHTDTLHLLIFNLHAVSERIHSDIVGVSAYPLMNNIIESLVINMLLWCFKLYLMSKMISSTIGGNAVILNKTKTQFNNFTSFVKYETISEKTVEEVKEHLELVNTKHGGHAINTMLSKLSDKIRLDIKKQLFTKTLQTTPFFRSFSSHALRVFFDFFDIRYYKIGAEIIRCNDVQRNIYVVSKGSVDIVVAADTLITLVRGGAFGCFTEKGITRQTILARSNVHVELLVIDSAIFYKHLAPYPALWAQFQMKMNHNVEYIESIESTSTLSSTKRFNDRKLWALTLACSQFYNKFNKHICLTSKHYTRYTLAVIHVAALSSIMLIVLSFIRKLWILAAFSYICDLFFWSNIVIMFHMQYIDPETGVRITSPNLIRKRYAKSLKFWVTFLGSLPIEIIPLIARADRFVVACFFSNRLLRFVLAMIYNQELNKKLSFSNWFQWLYIVYLMMFQIGFMSLIWYTVACHFETCMHRVNTGPTKEMGRSGERNEILLSLLYVVILFTAAGVRTVSSVTISQITITVLISNASLIITSIMIGVLASLLIIKDITANRYKNKVETMKLYFKSLHLSPYLCDRIYESMVMLWMRRRGELLPKIVQDAPAYIQQDVMMSLYGSHLTRHELFGKMHKDMLKQMCVHLKVGLYTPDQLIVDKGDRDGCMYFLHRGQIRVIDDNAEESIVVSSYFPFGEEQGIYGVPHRKTYVAYTTIDLLLLEKSVWDYLLQSFPASKEIIVSGFLKYGVDPDNSFNERETEEIIID